MCVCVCVCVCVCYHRPRSLDVSEEDQVNGPEDSVEHDDDATEHRGQVGSELA